MPRKGRPIGSPTNRFKSGVTAKQAQHKHNLRADHKGRSERQRVLAEFTAPFRRALNHIDEIYAARQRNEARRIAEIAADKVDGVWFTGMRELWHGCERRARLVPTTQHRMAL